MQKVSNIKAAIYDKLKADTTLMALITKVFGLDVDPGTVIPYVSYFVVTASQQDTFNEGIDRYLIQIDCYAKATATKYAWQLSGEIASAVAGALDNATLTITDHASICCHRVSTRELYDTEGKIHRFSMDYRVMVCAD